MGGFFSSDISNEPAVEPRRKAVAYSYEDNFCDRRVTTERNSLEYYGYRKVWNTHNIPNRAYTGGNSSVLFSKPQVYSQCEYYDPNYFPFSKKIPFTTPPVYQLSPIGEEEYEYRDIRRRITNKNFKIISIEKIENSLLESSYSCKKNQKLQYYPHLEELELFHGTKWIHADSICKNNFNWRCQKAHKFGKGVSFSCNAMYASNYSDANMQVKVMLIAKVLIGETCLGSEYMELPEEGCDTSTKQHDNIVVVKYEDNEFYPIYRIRYRLSPGYTPMNKRNRGR